MYNRLGILAMHDKDGIVDDYILYLLNDIKQVLNHIIIVCNGDMKKSAIVKLKEYTNDIFIRPDIGYDAGAFKDVLENLLGWDKVYQYDELVILNDSFFGPFESFSSIFEKMDLIKADFWGLTSQPQTECPYEVYGMNTMPYHIQPYFLVIRNNLMKSYIFREFWRTMEQVESYIQAVINYELRMTQFFNSHGFQGAVYVDITSIIEKNTVEKLILIYEYAYQLISINHMPVIKKRYFVTSQDSGLIHSINEDILRTMHYIEHETKYDVNLIWKNLIRNYDPVELKQSIHLEYILPYKTQTCLKREKNEVAVIAHLYYEDLLNESFNYLKNVPGDMDIFITVQNTETAKLICERYSKEEFRHIEVRIVENRGRDVSALLVGCQDILMKYKYLCFVHDKKTSGNIGPAKIGMSYMYMLWENMLKSEYYIENIIYLLEKEKHLGVLVPPSPYHGDYLNNYGNEWTCCYSGTRALAEKMKLKCIMSSENPPYTLSTAFWCKTQALKSLFEFGFKYEDFPKEPLPSDGSIGHYIERILAYVAQHEGYTTGIVMNESFASLQISNYNYMLNNLLVEKRQQGFFEYYYGIVHPEQFWDYIDLPGLLSFSKMKKKLYIYGTGGIAGKITAYLTVNHIKFNGFIVSKGHKNKDYFSGKKVHELHEIQDIDIGIILGLNEENTKEIYPLLQQLGYSNIYKIK